MNVATIFGEDAQSGNSEAGDDEQTPAEQMQSEIEVGSDEFTAYLRYEQAVDMLRTVNGVQRVSDDDTEALKGLAKELLATKKTFADGVSDLPGNLPTFREAFPVEDREAFGEDFYVLPEDTAAKLEVSYDDEDSLVLPVVDGVNWNPSLSIEDSEAEDDDETEDTSGVGDMTVAEIRSHITTIEDGDDLATLLSEEKDGKARKTALAAIEGRIRAVEDGEQTSDDDDDGEDSEAVSDEDLKLAALRQKVANGDDLTSEEMEFVLNR